MTTSTLANERTRLLSTNTSKTLFSCRILHSGFIVMLLVILFLLTTCFYVGLFFHNLLIEDSFVEADFVLPFLNESAFASYFPQRNNTLVPSSFWSNPIGPHQTNRWWENIVLGAGDNIINSFPFMMKALSSGLVFGFPDKVISPTFVISGFVPLVTMTAKSGIKAHKVDGSDLFAVNITYPCNNQQNGQLKFPLVRGSPYITGIYQNCIPSLSFATALLSVNRTSTPSGSISGKRLTLGFNNGQIWYLYSDRIADWEWTTNSLVAISSTPPNLNPQKWIIRMAGVPSTLEKTIQTHYEAVLDNYSIMYPVGANLDWYIDYQHNLAITKINWITNIMENVISAEERDSQELLLLGLPHHLAVLTNLSSKIINVTYGCLFGNLTGLTGSHWEMTDTFSDITWTSGINLLTIPNILLSDLNSSLYTDSANLDNIIQSFPPDPYGFGKAIARLARLALIADELECFDVATKIRNAIKNAFEPWISGTNSDPLQYDPLWGGICSLAGLKDPQQDYGNGRYNDHHFHYGYFLYAAAVVAKVDPNWSYMTSNFFLGLFADIANPQTGFHNNFPQFRYYDWFVSHSWAAGLFPMVDGRNQESISEAINAWYGVMLYGMAINNSYVHDTGRILLTGELRGGKTYWHMENDSIYPEVFAQGTCVGMVQSDKVAEATWFGANPVYVCCINMLPFTPISQDLLNAGYIKDVMGRINFALSKSSNLPDQWRGFIILALAILNPEQAWQLLNKITAYDDGNSRTNSLYWIASQYNLKDCSLSHCNIASKYKLPTNWLTFFIFLLIHFNFITWCS